MERRRIRVHGFGDATYLIRRCRSGCYRAFQRNGCSAGHVRRRAVGRVRGFADSGGDARGPDRFAVDDRYRCGSDGGGAVRFGASHRRGPGLCGARPGGRRRCDDVRVRDAAGARLVCAASEPCDVAADGNAGASWSADVAVPGCVAFGLARLDHNVRFFGGDECFGVCAHGYSCQGFPGR